MNEDLPSFQSKILRRASGSHDFAIYQAALEWSLIDPIVIDGQEDIKSRITWRDRVEPFHHQVTNLITFCRRLPVTLLADDVGLGKTISAGLVASELISRRRISKVLVVAPKLLGPQWKEELETKFNLPTVVAYGQELIDADPSGDFGAVVTTYHAARAHLRKLPPNRFQMLVLDEAHKLRNLYGVAKTPQVALRFREVLEERMFRYVLMLTATPIQNRLWDLYSLIELLSVARGHDNPFGREGMFARRFIADNRTQARQLRPEARDEFRDIVYSYMSRVRRGDADLHFPDRTILLRKVRPIREELSLIKMLIEPLQAMNRLAQISILQALTSSPDALAAQLANMARNGTFPRDVATTIQAAVKQMPPSAKVQGLALLVEELRRENPTHWRLVVFTQRRETQTTIEAFLEAEGISVGIINGDSGDRNQDTIASLRTDPPEIHVIVSTEAGSEGVNLQSANVLVNFDLPWNPMIVEQRIGRIQRLASDHAKVFVYSVILAGTFEEYIVARLMEKLQMASHAIGDVEALLDASGINGEGDSEGFEEQIRRLVMESLAGKDVEAATELAVRSIEKANTTLEQEEKHINELLGGMNGAEVQGPCTPDLPPNEKSMELIEFVPAALRSLGAVVHNGSGNAFTVSTEGHDEKILVSEERSMVNGHATIYSPGSSAFDRLILRLTQSGLHNVVDADEHPQENIEKITKNWLARFGGSCTTVSPIQINRSFGGSAVLQVRATVAHDSYERLVSVRCRPEEHTVTMDGQGLLPVKPVIESPAECGIDEQALSRAAAMDDCLAEFCRFYKERRDREVLSVQEDERKRQKLSDDFTPRLQATLVGLQGRVVRSASVRVVYDFEGHEYESTLVVLPTALEVVKGPEFETCPATGSWAPSDVFAVCSQSNARIVAHHLVASDVSGRLGLPEYVVTCALSGKRVLKDEVESSAKTGRQVAKEFLKQSVISGVKAEPEFFGRCEVTQSDGLLDEIGMSDVSGRAFRLDQSARSVVSGKLGHVSEFIRCGVTDQILLTEEAEQCEVTGTLVLPGQLARCEISDRRVLPSELRRSDVSGRRALAQHLLKSSVSEMSALEDEAVISSLGDACTAAEAVNCNWSGVACHPDDVGLCRLTGLRFFRSLIGSHQPCRFETLVTLLNSPQPNADRTDLWPGIAEAIADVVGGKITVEATQISRDGTRLAIAAECRKFLGFKRQVVGVLYSISDGCLIGRAAVGVRKNGIWVSD